MTRLRVLTWHVHGNYLHYLSHAPHDFYVVTDAARSPGRAGRAGTLPWGDNVHEVRVEAIATHAFDVVLYQSRDAWEIDRRQLLTDAQRALPAIYLEHDPPQEHPTGTRHPVDDGRTFLVHCTPFNALMWDSGTQPVRIIEHGVSLPRPAHYSGERARGIVVVNNLDRRGRRLGHDLYLQARGHVPLDLVGLGAERIAGGRGSIDNTLLAATIAPYRFFFNPIRYSSLGLAVIEAMLVGLPIVGLATTELVTVIRNGANGYLDTRPQRLIEAMHVLLRDADHARALGEQARRDALARFSIERFARDWDRVLREVVQPAHMDNR